MGHIIKKIDMLFQKNVTPFMLKETEDMMWVIISLSICIVGFLTMSIWVIWRAIQTIMS